MWNRLDDRDIEEARSLGPIRDLLSVSGSVLVGMGGDPVEVLQPVATDRPGLVGPVNEVCRQLSPAVGHTGATHLIHRGREVQVNAAFRLRRQNESRFTSAKAPSGRSTECEP